MVLNTQSSTAVFHLSERHAFAGKQATGGQVRVMSVEQNIAMTDKAHLLGYSYWNFLLLKKHEFLLVPSSLLFERLLK